MVGWLITNLNVLPVEEVARLSDLPSNGGRVGYLLAIVHKNGNEHWRRVRGLSGIGRSGSHCVEQSLPALDDLGVDEMGGFCLERIHLFVMDAECCHRIDVALDAWIDHVIVLSEFSANLCDLSRQLNCLTRHGECVWNSHCESAEPVVVVNGCGERGEESRDETRS